MQSCSRLRGILICCAIFTRLVNAPCKARGGQLFEPDTTEEGKNAANFPLQLYEEAADTCIQPRLILIDRWREGLPVNAAVVENGGLQNYINRSVPKLPNVKMHTYQACDQLRFTPLCTPLLPFFVLVDTISNRGAHPLPFVDVSFDRTASSRRSQHLPQDSPVSSIFAPGLQTRLYHEAFGCHELVHRWKGRAWWR